MVTRSILFSVSVGVLLLSARASAQTPQKTDAETTSELEDKCATLEKRYSAALRRTVTAESTLKKVEHLRALDYQGNIVMVLKGESGSEEMKDLQPGETRGFRVETLQRHNGDVHTYFWRAETEVRAVLR